MLSKTTTKPLGSNFGISFCAALFTVLLMAALLMMSARSFAMHHLESEAATLEARQLAVAERMIDAFYSFDPEQLAPLLEHATTSSARILYYQGWAKGGNYKVLERAPCRIDENKKIACAITVQDDPVLALKTGFNVTDTFHLTFNGEHITAIETSSNDQPVYYEARKWVEANRPEVMSGPCKDRNAGGNTPEACARAMTKGYQEFYDAVVAPRAE